MFGTLVCSSLTTNLPDSGTTFNPAANGFNSSERALRPVATRTVSNSPCPF